MATEILLSERRHRTPRVACFTRLRWDDEWQAEPRLACDAVTFTANPDLATAEFTWRFGRVATGGSFQTRPRWDALRVFVKVEITLRDAAGDVDGEPILWYGILEQDNGQQKGILAAPSEATTAAGVQLLVAYGLDLLLARHVLLASTVDNGDGVESLVERGIDFNARAHASTPDRPELGNRSAELGEKLAYLFAGHQDEAVRWTSFEIVRYLLAYHAPKNQVDESEIPWQLEDQTFIGGILPDFDQPRVAQHGRSLRQVLDELADRRRLLGYTVDVQAPTDLVPAETVVLRAFTFAPEELEFEGNVIPANAEQVSLRFDDDTGVHSAVVRRGTLESIDQVICQGDRAVACFTLVASGDVVMPTGTLVPMWTTEEQDEYNAGASTLAGYGALELYEQQQWNQAARSVDRLQRVYRYFGLDVEWQGQVGKSGDGFVYFPASDDEPETALEYYLPGLRFSNHLPLKTDHDYSGTRIEQGEVLDHTPLGGKWEYLPPLVAVKLPGSAPERWQAVQHVGSAIEALQAPTLGLEDGVPWSGHVRMQEDWPGIVITVSGQPQHVLATADFAPLPADDDPGQFNWQDELLATVAMRVDRFAEGVWPDVPDDYASVRRMVVDVGDRYQLHHVARGTVTGLDKDGTWISSEGGYVRDDRPRLEALARLIYEWYHTERQSLDLQLGYLVDQVRVGQLVTTIGGGESELAVNSVITQLRYEFQEVEAGGSSAGDAPQARTRIVTQFAELDARRFLGRD